MNPTQKMRYFWMAIIIGVLGLATSTFRFFYRGALPKDMRAGGVELTYDVDLRRPVDERFSRSLDQVVGELRKAGATVGGVAPTPRSAVLTVPGLDPEKLKASLGDTGLVADPITPTGTVTVRLPDDLARTIEDAAMQQTARVVHDRLEKLAFCVPQVRQVDTRLLVALPGLDPARTAIARGVIALGGHLELREIVEGDALASFELPPDSPVRHGVDRFTTPTSTHEGHANYLEGSPAELEKVRATLFLPGGVEPLIEETQIHSGDEPPRPSGRIYLVSRQAEVTGEMVKDAHATLDKQSGWRIDLELDDHGTAAFLALSTRLVGKKLAIILDGRINSSPVVMSPIPGGRAQITLGQGNPTEQKRTAEDLALALRSGALPAPLRLAAERVVPPSQ